MVKKSKINAFWFFRCEKIRCEPFVSMTSKEDKEKAISDAWNNLNSIERAAYKGSISNQKSGDPLNCRGESIREVQEKLELEKKKKLALEHEVIMSIKNARAEGVLNDLTFYLIDITLFCYFEQQVYPAEVALAKFSLRQGNYQTLHFTINPGKLPSGSGSSALEKSTKEHRYDLPKFDENDNTDYYEIFEEILNFIDGDERDVLPIFYCQNELYINEKKVQLTLEKILHENSENSLMNSLKIFPIEHLLFHLTSETVEIQNVKRNLKLISMPSKVFAERKFKHYCMADGCEYHAIMDATRFCSLAKVRSFGYILAEYCCDFDNYPNIPGQHHKHLKSIYSQVMTDY